MRIGGFDKFSLVDYPGKISAVIFTQGCNFRCPYCHNPELVEPSRFYESILEDDVFRFLAKREGKLQAVTITGGEPTLQPGLLKFLRRLRNMNFLIKLDTNGSRPDVLEKVIELKLVDFIAMDIKAPLWKYDTVACSNVDHSAVLHSTDLIRNSGLKYQFRTTQVDALLTFQDSEEIKAWMQGQPHVFQPFVPTKVLNEEFLQLSKAQEEPVLAQVA